MNFIYTYFLLVPCGLLTFLGSGSITAQSAHIFFFYGATPSSHRIASWRLVEALVQRGHNVTFLHVLSPKENHGFSNKDSFNFNGRIQELNVPEANQYIDQALSTRDLLNTGLDGNMISDINKLSQWPGTALKVCHLILNSSLTQDWLRTSKVHLVMIDSSLNECGLGLAYKLRAPVIMFGAMSYMPWWQDVFGYSGENYWIPEVWPTYFKVPMSLLGRVITTLTTLTSYFVKLHTVNYPMESLIRTHLDLPMMPPLLTLEQNISLFLLNTHPVEEFPRALPPMFVSVGGIHCIDDPGGIIPEGLQTFIDNGKRGFVYVSFGTFVKVTDAHSEIWVKVMEAFREVPELQFIIKWDGALPVGATRNVYLSKWMPQQTLLAHPKIRGFISHGGLLGVQEGIYHGVPMILIPTYFEPSYISSRVVRNGLGLRLDILTLTKDNLKRSIQRLVLDENNWQSFKSAARRASRLFRTRERPPLDTAVWWTEFVIGERGDMSHLSPKVAHLNWYERRLLDVWVFIGLMIAALCYGVVKLAQGLFTFLYMTSGIKKTKKD